MKKIFILLLLGLFSLPALAGRIIPSYLALLEIRTVTDQTVSLTVPSWYDFIIPDFIDSTLTNVAISPGLRIRDESNRFVLRSVLPSLRGRHVGVRFDLQGQINEVWMLSPQEIDILKAAQERERQRKEALQQ